MEGVAGTVLVSEVKREGNLSVTTTIHIDTPKQWSAEAPHRYILVGQLKNNKGEVVETFSTALGFCKVEIKDTRADEDEFGLAGRYFYVNGKPVKLKGVNRQEINPATGNAISHEQMQEEIMLMKRGNINHVRNMEYIWKMKRTSKVINIIMERNPYPMYRSLRQPI